MKGIKAILIFFKNLVGIERAYKVNPIAPKAPVRANFLYKIQFWDYYKKCCCKFIRI